MPTNTTLTPPKTPLPTSPKPTTQQPFCGFEPASPEHAAGSFATRSYAVKGASRGKATLTWRVAPGTTINGVSSPATQITTACSRWMGAAPQLRLTQSNTGSADITINSGTFTNAATIASTTSDGVTITVNSAYTFRATAASAPSGTDFLDVITHEIGHALGLLHATTNTSIMWAYASAIETLQPDDIAAIRALYSWSAQRNLGGIGTDQLPSICACGNSLLMVWKGIGSDHNIWHSISGDGGATWTPQKTINGAATTASPSLAWDGARVWMAWVGTAGDDSLYWSNSTDLFQANSNGVQHLGDRGSSHGPRIAIVNGTPTMVWKGVNNDSGIYYSTFHGSWSPQANIAGIATAAAPAICQDITGGVRMVWRGSGTDQTFWTANIPANLHPVQTRVTWQIPGNGGQPSTYGTPASQEGPSITLANGHIYMTWRGIAGDDSLYYTQLANDGTPAAPLLQWSVQSHIPNAGGELGVSLTILGSTVHAVWKGIPGDHGIYTATL